MVIPAFLQKGDVVAIVASARKISIEELNPAIAFLESYGLVVFKGKNIYQADHQFAGNDAERAEDLQWALNHKEVKCIFFARGGYGTVRLIDQLDFSEFLNHPKWLAGYSDITVLHNALNRFNVASLHSTMPINFHKNILATQTMMNALFGEALRIDVSINTLNRIGMANGVVVGGNLSLIYSLSGTAYDLNTDGKILFIEDLDEYIYHIDRMMLQLKLSGKLRNLAGLIVGSMTEMKDNTVPFGKTAEEVIFDAVKEYNYPVCFNFPAGHIDNNMALVFGSPATLNVRHQHVNLSYK